MIIKESQHFIIMQQKEAMLLPDRYRNDVITR